MLLHRMFADNTMAHQEPASRQERPRRRWFFILLPVVFWASGVTADGGSAHHGGRWSQGPGWYQSPGPRFHQSHREHSWRWGNRGHRWINRGNGVWWGARDWRFHNRHQQWAASVGGLVTGITIGQHLSHDRDCDHHRRDYRRRERIDRHRVTGCYRIEQLPNGRERRVAIPLANCR